MSAAPSSASAPSAPAVLFERFGHTAVMTLNRPRALNAVNGRLWLEAGRAIDTFAQDPQLRVLILTAAGDRAFCAGSDLKEKAAGGFEITDEMRGWGYAGIVRHHVGKPVIAAVNGFALGGGTEIALSCDLIVASEKATFGLPEARHGLIAGAGGLLRLPRQIPLKVAMNCILTGAALSAQEALHWGLVNEVVPHERLLPAAMAMAERICLSSPTALQASKELVYRALDLPLDFPGRAWELNEQYVEQVHASDDAHEGPQAFLEKRPPVWKAPS